MKSHGYRVTRDVGDNRERLLFDLEETKVFTRYEESWNLEQLNDKEVRLYTYKVQSTIDFE